MHLSYHDDFSNESDRLEIGGFEKIGISVKAVVVQVTCIVVYNNFRSCKKSQLLASYRLFLLSRMNTI